MVWYADSWNSLYLITAHFPKVNEIFIDNLQKVFPIFYFARHPMGIRVGQNSGRTILCQYLIGNVRSQEFCL